MKQKIRRRTAGFLIAAMVAGQCTPAMVSEAAPMPAVSGDGIVLADGSGAAPVIVDGASEELDGLMLNAQAFADDIELVTGKEPQIYKAEVLDSGIQAEQGSVDTAIIVGTVDDSIITALAADNKLDAAELSAIENGYEQYNIQIVENPMDGVENAVVIAGSDKRGAVYGLYHISQDLAGVSPWYYWGDVPVETQEELVFDRSELEMTSEAPSVRYRGIFLNDEAPSLSSWVNKFGGYNQDFYDHVFELVLRLKGNYLWPAMWSNNFSEDGTEIVDGQKDIYANARHADAWGVVMGTSHHEPMCRAGVEWQRIYRNYGTSNEWNFFTNGDAIAKFWYDGAKRNQAFENVITIGMRGEADSELTHPDGTPFTLGDQINVLKSAITSQKNSLQELGLEDAPQMICLYKEVEDAWYGDASTEGLNKWEVLQNDIVMLCEDNHGNLRTLPTEEDKAFHKGGWGMYYHFDYHGGPTSYEWVNTVPLEKVWNNMTMAYDHGIQDMWIVNVGDLKPMELPISYFLDMAYDFDTWGTENPNSQDAYTAQWVEQQFGSAPFDAEAKADIAQILHDYPSLSAVKKPEELKSSTYSAVNYNELQRKLAEAIDLEARAEKHLAEVSGSDYEDAYWQLVYYPAAATANVYKMQLFAGLNDLYYSRGSVAANAYASLIADCVQRDKDLQNYYNNTMSGGKWKGMMSSNHVGYVTWNDEGWSYPVQKYVTPADGGVMLVDVDGTKECAKEGELVLPEFTSTGQETRALTISNGGNEKVSYTITADAEWIDVAAGEGSVQTARTLPVAVDWTKLSESAEGTITVTSSKGKTVTVKVNAVKIDADGLEDGTYTFSDGVASILASEYVEKDDGWVKLDGLGRTGSTMKVFPTTAFYEAGEGPSLTYKVLVPEDGDYKLTVFVGPSNNVYSDARVRYGVQIDGGSIAANDTIEQGYTGGDGNGWGNSIRGAGRSVSTSHSLSAGVHEITIYGMDAGLLLEKLVLSRESLKTSHMGPAETWHAGMESTRQPLVHYQTEEAMALPGTIYAVDAAGIEVETENGVLAAKEGTEYTYPVTVSEDGSYLFGVRGSSAEGASVTLKYNGQVMAELQLSEVSGLVSAEDGFDLTRGAGTVTLEVTGSALIDTIVAEKLNTEPGLPVTVIASSTADGSSAEYAYDSKRSTGWEPAESDADPYIGLDFDEIVSTDWFRLNGSFDDVDSYEIQMMDESEEWHTVYQAEEAPESGEKVYIQGSSACSGSQWRVVFHGGSGSLKVTEMELSTYINWAMDENTVVTVASAESGKYKDGCLTDGDRIALTSASGAWIASQVSSSNGNNYAVMEFGEERTLSGVNLVAMQDTVYQLDGKYYWKNDPQGEIPDDSLMSSHVQRSYTVYYRSGGEWVKASSVATTDDSAKTVLTQIAFDQEITTDALKIEVGTWYWILMAEIEAYQTRRYTLDGVKEGYKNWALADNGGEISVSSTFSQKKEFLNDGIRICDNGNENRWRCNIYPAWVEIALPETIAVDTINIFGQQNTDKGNGIEPTKELNNAYKYTPMTIQYNQNGTWVDGKALAESNLVWNQWKPETSIVTDKIRLYVEKSVGDSFLRLCEVEVYGLAAEEDDEPDDPNELTNWALAANGATAVATAGGEGSASAVIDGDVSFNNGGRWRINNKESSITITMDGEKEISRIDLISQQTDDSKVDGKYPEPDLNTKTNLGIKKANVYAMTDSGEWQLIYVMDNSGTSVWNQMNLEEPVVTGQIKVEFPENAGNVGWVRVIEIQAWGRNPQEEVFVTDSIRVATNPDKMQYGQGEEFDPSGMVVEAVQKATSSNAEPVENIVTLSNDELEYTYDFSQAGEAKVTITWKEESGDGTVQIFETFVTVTVNDSDDEEPEYHTAGIFVKENPAKMNYELKEAFDPEGMIVQAHQVATPGNAVKNVTIPNDELEFEYDFSKAGEAKVAIRWEEECEDGESQIFETFVTVTVNGSGGDDPDDPEDEYYTRQLYVSTKPAKRIYEIDEEFDPEGMVVKAFQQATPSEATRNVVIPNDELEFAYDFSEAGEAKVTILYQGTDKDGEPKEFTTYIVVTVNDVIDEDEEYYTQKIAVKEKPVKLVYEIDEEFDPDGMVVEAVQKASDSNASRTVTIPNDELDFDYDFSEAGSAKVTVVYLEANAEGEIQEFTDTVSVTVTEDGDEDDEYYTQKITVKKKPTKLVYEIDEEFDPDGMIIQAEQKTTVSGVTRTVTVSNEELDFEYDFSAAGTREVTVIYYGEDKNLEEKKFTVKIRVDVAEPAEEGSYVKEIKVAKLPTQTEYYVGDSLRMNGMEVYAVVVDLLTGEETEVAVTSCKVTPSVFMVPGIQKVTISYIGTNAEGKAEVFEDSFSVTVKVPGDSDKPDPAPDDGGDDSNNGGDNSGSNSGTHSSTGSGAHASSGSSSGSSSSVSGSISVATGTWKQQEDGTWQFIANNRMYRSEWAYLANPYAKPALGHLTTDWFRFDENGTMVTGWYTDDDGLRYYLSEVSDGGLGHMVTGWKWIADENGEEKCYYFNPVSDGTKGSLLTDTVTPDGYKVDENGCWVP